MKRIIFLSLKDVLYIHDAYIKHYGGSFGVRDSGLLESALKNPEATFNGAYLHNDIYDMAAAYAYGLIKNHPFVDGNKRTGITSALVFLRSNDAGVFIKKNELHPLAVSIATNNVSQPQLAQLFRKYY